LTLLQFPKDILTWYGFGSQLSQQLFSPKKDLWPMLNGHSVVIRE